MVPKPSRPTERTDRILLEFLRRAQDCLSSSDDLRDHFAAAIQWLDERRSLWTSRCWRIGLLGITSSGKSTLLNALMNDRLLPARVRPSSNTLVICFRSDSSSAVIHFVDGREERLSDGLADALAKIADEATNPGNSLGIKEIELSSPSFALGEDVEMVDTPGLDARGYDEHEKLTLKTLLPTVDLAIFLTTAKATSDLLTKRYLDVIGEAGKPVLVVQNMIDSVEPKLGRLGVEEKSRSVVAEECRLRLHRLLQRCSSPLVSRANIVQVSAQRALEGRTAESQLPVLIGAVRRELELLAPRLEQGRRVQLLRHLEEIVRQEREATSGAVVASRRSTEDHLERWAQRIEELLEDVSAALTKARSDASRKGDKFKVTAEGITATDLEGAEALKKSLATWTRAVPEGLSTILDNATVSLRSLASDLNLAAEDFELPAPRGAPRGTVAFETSSRTEYVSRPKRGFVAGFKRFFGFETYEDVPVPVPVVKAVGAFRSDVAGLVANELDWLQEASGALRSTITKQASRLNQELDRRRRQVELQRASQLKATKRIAAADALAAIVSDLAPGATMEGIANPATLPPQVWSNDRLQTAVPLPVGTLLQLAAVAARSRHIAMRRTCIERVSRGKPSPRRALIWGWDLGYVSRFLELYWPDLEETVTPRTGGMTRWDGVPPLNELGVIVEEALTPDSETATSDDLETFLAEPTILFLLLDPHQVGSTDSWLNERSMLGRHVRRFAGSVVVAQSLRSLLHSTEALAEGVLELRRMTYEAGLEPRAFLANDDSSSLTALLDALWIAPSVRTHRDEQQMLAALASRWFHPPIVAADLVRDWCRLASGASSNA